MREERLGMNLEKLETARLDKKDKGCDNSGYWTALSIVGVEGQQNHADIPLIGSMDKMSEKAK